MIRRQDCNCLCHRQPGVVHVVACCDGATIDTFAAADRTKAAFEQREAGIATMRATLDRLRAALNPAERTYHWLHANRAHDIRYPQWDDREIAGRVRMVVGTELVDESIVTAARDRIMHLSEIVAAARALLNDSAASCSRTE